MGTVLAKCRVGLLAELAPDWNCIDKKLLVEDIDLDVSLVRTGNCVDALELFDCLADSLAYLSGLSASSRDW
jgi:hypothetical protein